MSHVSPTYHSSLSMSHVTDSVMGIVVGLMRGLGCLVDTEYVSYVKVTAFDRCQVESVDTLLDFYAITGASEMTLRWVTVGAANYRTGTPSIVHPVRPDQWESFVARITMLPNRGVTHVGATRTFRDAFDSLRVPYTFGRRHGSTKGQSKKYYNDSTMYSGATFMTVVTFRRGQVSLDRLKRVLTESLEREITRVRRGPGETPYRVFVRRHDDLVI